MKGITRKTIGMGFSKDELWLLFDIVNDYVSSQVSVLRSRDPDFVYDKNDERIKPAVLLEEKLYNELNHYLNRQRVRK